MPSFRRIEHGVKVGEEFGINWAIALLWICASFHLPNYFLLDIEINYPHILIFLHFLNFNHLLTI
jgi:hypothetical protein